MTDAVRRTLVRAVWTIPFLCLAIIAGIPPASGSETTSTRALADQARPIDRAALDRQLDLILQPGRDAEMALSVWVGGPSGEAWYARDADVWRPAASSIKTAYLIELFAAYADGLDAAVKGVAAIVADPTHPAIVHFDADTQTDIREHLSAASVREIGRMMIRGTGVSNAVYNAAANVTTAVLGGPEALTTLMRERDPAFAGLASRRYMLAARDVTGDNDATAASLAAALRRIAAHEVRGSRLADRRRDAGDPSRAGRRWTGRPALFQERIAWQ